MYFNINITKHVFEMNLKMIKPTLLLFYMDSTYYWSIGFWDDTCVFGFTSNIFRSFERPVYRFCRSNSGAQKTLDVAINASNYLEMARKTKIQTGGKNNETRRDRNERKNCLRKCFHSSKYLIVTRMFAFSSSSYTASCDSFCTTYCIFLDCFPALTSL